MAADRINELRELNVALSAHVHRCVGAVNVSVDIVQFSSKNVLHKKQKMSLAQWQFLRVELGEKRVLALFHLRIIKIFHEYQMIALALMCGVLLLCYWSLSDLELVRESL